MWEMLVFYSFTIVGIMKLSFLFIITLTSYQNLNNCLCNFSWRKMFILK